MVAAGKRDEDGNDRCTLARSGIACLKPDRVFRYSVEIIRASVPSGRRFIRLGFRFVLSRFNPFVVSRIMRHLIQNAPMRVHSHSH